MAETLSGKLLGLYVILLASLELQAYVQSNDPGHIGTLEHMLLRQTNHGKRFVLDVTSHSSSARAPDDLKPLEGSRCTRFVKCVNGRWYFQANKCPPNFLWNGDKSSCDYAVNVDVSTCTSRQHEFNSHTPSTDSRTIAPTTTVQHTNVPTHGTTCGPSECFNGRCYHTITCDEYGHHCSERHYGCSCNPGYVGDMCDQFKVNVQHCVDQGFHCHHGDCVYNDVKADYACHCWIGYVGKQCEKHLVYDSHCSAIHLHCLHGDCVYDTVHMNYGCHCTGHYTGHQCDIQITNSGSGTIAPTSTAHLTTTTPPTHLPKHGISCGHYECFHGRCNMHNISHCSNGYCESYRRCDCFNGYVGENCNQRNTTVNHCQDAGLNCHHGCVYDTVQSEYACHCNSGYTGRHCSLQKTQESHCWNSNLQCHHGECVHEIGHSNYACHCTPEYSGKQCSLRIVYNNECTSHGFRCIHGQCLQDSISYSYYRSYRCDCHHGYTGAHCDNQIGTVITATPSISTRTTTTAAPTSTQTTTAKPPISTSTAAPTTSTPSTTQATTVPIHYYKCDKIATVINLVNQIPVNDTTGGSCPSGSFATPEAFVLDHCNVTFSSKWTQGVNIMKQCNDIPVYTPVATFSNQIYASSGGLSGIFLGCLPNGFKLGVQQCGNLPTIIHVNYGGFFTMNPNLYYTVQ